MSPPEALGPPTLCLMGPTASGKSALAMALAREFPIEIISVDSALVYRGMDIGTAKPNHAERAGIPHHLIDIADPEDNYSAARFVSDAKSLIAAVRARHRIPLLVGGTMLYFRALQQGIDAMPAADSAIRAEIEYEASQKGWGALHQQLAGIDPVTASRLAPGDSQRIQRALEVYRASGIALSAWHQQRYQDSDANARRARYANLALMPSQRSVLHQRIEQRFDAMLEAGLIDEVAVLLERPRLNRQAPALRAVGYRQVVQYLLGEADRHTMRERALAATRQLAKHQFTWLRSTRTDAIIDTLAPNAASAFLERASELLAAEADALARERASQAAGG